MIFIGIDPGKKGGVAVIQRCADGSKRVLSVHMMPVAGKEIDFENLADIIWVTAGGLDEPVVACIEKVGAITHRRNGKVVKEGVVSMFSFGVNVGALFGIMAAFTIPYYKVPPQTWKKVVLAGTLKDKAAAIDFCRQAYPDINLLATERSKVAHSGIADALCIATYATIKY